MVKLRLGFLPEPFLYYNKKYIIIDKKRFGSNKKYLNLALQNQTQ
jgi:hypothetical protein